MTSHPSAETPLKLAGYDRRFLMLSTDWLADPETRALTMTPPFTRAEQELFFSALPSRTDYHIWGIVQGDDPIGAGGIKNVTQKSGEYWAYIGPKHLWGQGLGRHIIRLIERRAIDLGLRSLFLRVSEDNPRAIRLYETSGYTEHNRSDSVIVMHKDIGK